MNSSMFIGRRWVTGRSGSASPSQVETALSTADRGAAQMRDMSIEARRAVLDRVASGLESAGEEIATTIVAEMGKPISEARSEAARLPGIFRLASAELLRPEGEVLALDALPAGAHKLGLTLRSPCGVVVAITPFNYPAILVSHKLAPAIAAGNSVILKPASATPLTAAIITRVILDSGLPPDALQCVVGPGQRVGSALARDPRVRMISLTGSTAAGEAITRVAGVKRLSLELGGNAPVIVAADADLDLAAGAIAATGFANAGQACISAQRILVDEAVAPALLDRLAAAAAGIRRGDARDTLTQLAGLVTEREARRVEAMVGQTIAAGATLVTGGGRDGSSVEATVIDAVTPGMPTFDHEIFGPVIAVTRVTGLDEGIRMANATPYGLSAAVFTRDVSQAIHAARSIEAGNVMVNWGPLWRSDLMPYGGWKSSGIGKEGVRYAIDEMSETKTVVFHGPAR